MTRALFLLLLTGCTTKLDTGYVYTCESHCWYVCHESYSGFRDEDGYDNRELYQDCTDSCSDAPESDGYSQECSDFITTTKQTLDGE